jgi:hypothetical protein
LNWERLPFIKRKAYDGETEFRILYENLEKEEDKKIIIDLSCILKIFLNPWLP